MNAGDNQPQPLNRPQRQTTTPPSLRHCQSIHHAVALDPRLDAEIICGLTDPRLLAGKVLHFPVRQNVLSTRLIVIVGGAKPLGPIFAVAGVANAPCTGSPVAPVAQLHAAHDRHVIGLLAAGQFKPRRAVFEFCGAYSRRHGVPLYRVPANVPGASTDRSLTRPVVC